MMHPAQKHARTTSHTPTATLMTHLRAEPSPHDFSLHGAAARMGDHGNANSSTGKREQVMSWHGLHISTQKGCSGLPPVPARLSPIRPMRWQVTMYLLLHLSPLL